MYTLVELTLSDKSQEPRTRASLLTVLLRQPSTDVLRDLHQLRTYPTVYHTRTAPMGHTHPRDLKKRLDLLQTRFKRDLASMQCRSWCHGATHCSESHTGKRTLHDAC